MLGISGYRSEITQKLLELLPEGEDYRHGCVNMLRTDLDRYFLCAGYLAGKSARHISDADSGFTWNINFMDVVRFCDRVLDNNANARICVMGSLSGINGSFDAAYAGSKAALHTYVRTKRLHHAGQQIVAIAPGKIEDTGMTQRREDLAETLLEASRSRRGRMLMSYEIARIAHFLLYVDEGAITNTVIEVKG